APHRRRRTAAGRGRPYPAHRRDTAGGVHAGRGGLRRAHPGRRPGRRRPPRKRAGVPARTLAGPCCPPGRRLPGHRCRGRVPAPAGARPPVPIRRIVAATARPAPCTRIAWPRRDPKEPIMPATATVLHVTGTVAPDSAGAMLVLSERLDGHDTFLTGLLD